MLSGYVTDNQIVCENCYKLYVGFNHIINSIDIDDDTEDSKNAISGIINRVTCPYCDTEFTYEVPLFMFSQADKYGIISAFEDEYVNIHSFNLASKISGISEWKLRKCAFAMDSAEKVRIFKANLDDGKIELLKLSLFDKYRDMNLVDEYIVFDSLEGDNLFFSHRDFTDVVLDKYKVPISEYSLICDTNIPCGNWINIDRSWAINFMEDTKK